MNDLKKLTEISFDSLLTQQAIFTSPDPCFDLRKTAFLSPGAMAQIVAACELLHRDGKKPSIRLADSSLANYLLRSNFVSLLGPIAKFNPPYKDRYLNTYDRYYGGNDLLIELTKLESSEPLGELLAKIIAVLRSHLSYPDKESLDLAVAVSEAIQNTFEHNPAGEATCYFAMQVYGTPPNRFLEIGIADTGRGLATTLKENPANLGKFDRDLEAVVHATLSGVSRHDDPTHGTGFHHLINIIYSLGGSVQLRSGAGSVRFRMDRQRGYGRVVPTMPGVQIVISVPNKHAED